MNKLDLKKIWFWPVVVPVLSSLWLVAYLHLDEFADSTITLLRLRPETALGGALRFFFYDAPKVMLLLIGVVFIMGVIQTFFAPERVRALLAGRKLGIGNVIAATIGIFTPFCSCSAVPIFIGFVSSGVPLGVTFSFLISAPMINEVAMAMLLGMFGWKIAALYLVLGLLIAITAGLVIGKLNMEEYLQEWVRNIRLGQASGLTEQTLTWDDRCNQGANHVHEIVGKVWPWVLIGVAVGAVIHGYVPQDFMVAILGKDAWWAVPTAVLLGIPMYSNAAGILPIVEALIGKGAALGTTLAFMMSVIALSAPELLILRKVLRWQLIFAFVLVVASGIVLVGYIFNFLL